MIEEAFVHLTPDDNDEVLLKNSIEEDADNSRSARFLNMQVAISFFLILNNRQLF